MMWIRQPSLSIQSPLFPTHPTIFTVIKQCSLKPRQGRSAITANFTPNVPRSSSCCFDAGCITKPALQHPPAAPPAHLGHQYITKNTRRMLVCQCEEKFHKLHQETKKDGLNCTISAQMPVRLFMLDLSICPLCMSPLFSLSVICAGGGQEKTGCRSTLLRWMTVILLLSFVITLEKGTDWVKHGMKKQTIYSIWQAEDWLAQFWPMTDCL